MNQTINYMTIRLLLFHLYAFGPIRINPFFYLAKEPRSRSMNPSMKPTLEMRGGNIEDLEGYINVLYPV